MRINKLLIIFGVAAITLGSCSDYEDKVVPSDPIASDCPEVRFASDNPSSFEIDPSSELALTLKVVRKKTSTVANIPVTVVTNTDNSFVVPTSVNFAAGDSTAVLKISVNSTAKKGVAIPFVIKFAEQYVNPYKVEYATYYGEASVIQWNNLGTAQFFDSFCFSGSSASYATLVKLEQRDDKPEIFRISYPYGEDILNAAEWTGWIGGTTQSSILFTVNGSNVVWNGFWYTNLLYQGTAGEEVKAYMPSELGKTGDDKSVVVKNDDGSVKYFKLYPYYYVDGVGGWGMKVAYLAFPGFDIVSALGLTVL